MITVMDHASLTYLSVVLFVFDCKYVSSSSGTCTSPDVGMQSLEHSVSDDEADGQSTTTSANNRTPYEAPENNADRPLPPPMMVNPQTGVAEQVLLPTTYAKSESSNPFGFNIGRTCVDAISLVMESDGYHWIIELYTRWSYSFCV